MESLPDELLYRIMDESDVRDLGRIGAVNQRLNNVARDERLWKNKTYKRYGEVSKICDSWKHAIRRAHFVASPIEI